MSQFYLYNLRLNLSCTFDGGCSTVWEIIPSVEKHSSKIEDLQHTLGGPINQSINQSICICQKSKCNHYSGLHI